MKKVLVTGGAGFIGSYLVDRLIDEGYQVVVVDDLSKGKLANVNKKAEFINLDITSNEFEKFLIKLKPKLVFHLAAQSNLRKSLINPQKDMEINLFATQKILEQTKKLRVEKIIFASSAAVYSEANQLPIKEDQKKEPISIYGVAKLCSEYLIRNHCRSKNLQYVNLRFSNVYGERQDTNAEGGVVAIFIKKILNNQKVNIFSDGRQTRDFIYVSDIISACLECIKKDFTGEFNISTGKETAILNLYENLLKITKSKPNKRFQKPHYKEVRRNSLSWAKFNTFTDWMPRVTLQVGLKRTIEHFKNL